MVLFGSFLPWIDTAVGSVSGARGAGLWTFYAAMLGLAAALIPMRRVAAVQAMIFAGVALLVPAWQVVHLLTPGRHRTAGCPVPVWCWCSAEACSPPPRPLSCSARWPRLTYVTRRSARSTTMSTGPSTSSRTSRD